MVGTFPLNVQAGSPQYTTAGEITPSSSTTSITVTIPNTGSTNPISNAYYTVQNEDGSKWCTFYVESWTNVGGFVPPDAPATYNLICEYTSSNTSDVFPEGSICWCIWCKEYYDSLVTPISTVNNEISTINNEIDTLTPKVNNSFVSATKTDDTTLRLIRNDGTTVDISFPEGLNVKTVDFSNSTNRMITVLPNELIIITGSNNPDSTNTTYTFSFANTKYGYVTVTGNYSSGESFINTYGRGKNNKLSNCSGTITFEGLLYGDGILKYVRK